MFCKYLSCRLSQEVTILLMEKPKIRLFSLSNSILELTFIFLKGSSITWEGKKILLTFCEFYRSVVARGGLQHFKALFVPQYLFVSCLCAKRQCQEKK